MANKNRIQKLSVTLVRLRSLPPMIGRTGWTLWSYCFTLNLNVMILRYKAIIPGNRIFMREYDLDSRMTLYKLHEFLCRDLCFSPDQMTVFDTFSASGKPGRRIGMFDFGDGSMDMITLENTAARKETVLRYTYNLNLQLALELQLEGEQEYNRRFSYPMLVAEKGRNPDQFSAVYEDYEEFSDNRSSRIDTSSEAEDESFEDDELPEGEESI